MGTGEQAKPELVVIYRPTAKSGSLLIIGVCHILSREMRVRNRKMFQNAAFRAFTLDLGLVLLLVSPHNDICRNTMMTDGNEKKVLTIVPWDSLGCKLGLECPSEDVLVFFFYLFMVFYLSYDRTQRGILFLGICYADERMLAYWQYRKERRSYAAFCNFRLRGILEVLQYVLLWMLFEVNRWMTRQVAATK
jgi:hypothetical protein